MITSILGASLLLPWCNNRLWLKACAQYFIMPQEAVWYGKQPCKPGARLLRFKIWSCYFQIICLSLLGCLSLLTSKTIIVTTLQVFRGLNRFIVVTCFGSWKAYKSAGYMLLNACMCAEECVCVLINLKNSLRDFPGGPAVKSSSVNECRGHGFNPLSRKLYPMWQGAAEPMSLNNWRLHVLEPVLCNKRSPSKETSMYHTWREAPTCHN